ncbi:MAG: hypothetical protein E7540_00540 [Ruminococcaceae bacterium]|nr:hypothetical protein [Oscillospiraceae bacterium]
MKFFLASNSAQGFISEFKNCYEPKDDWYAYIIKGGPGTGKSSFMRKLVKKAEEKGLEVLKIYCASDPSSLDGVLIPKLKTAVLDGTAPHTVDPTFPGVSECILNFGDFWDENLLKKQGREIIKLTTENKKIHKSVSEQVVLAGGLMEEDLKASQRLINSKETEKLASTLINEYIPNTNKNGKIINRFLGGITPKGVLYFGDSILAKKTISILDPVGSVSNAVFEQLKEEGVKRGFDTVVFKNPVLPNTLIDGIYLPELNICFLREYEHQKAVADKTFFAKDYMVTTAFMEEKGNACLVSQLLESSAKLLRQAKENHDQLEKCYISAMDFESLNSFCDLQVEKIVK